MRHYATIVVNQSQIGSRLKEEVVVKKRSTSGVTLCPMPVHNGGNGYGSLDDEQVLLYPPLASTGMNLAGHFGECVANFSSTFRWEPIPTPQNVYAVTPPALSIKQVLKRCSCLVAVHLAPWLSL